MIPPEKIDTYRKVRAHAEQNTGGERANAERILAQMEARYPGIREAAAGTGTPRGAPAGGGFDWQGFAEDFFGKGGIPRPPPAGAPRRDFTGTPPSAGPNLRELFEAARDFLKSVEADLAAEEKRKALVAEHTDVTSRWTDSGDLVVRVRVSPAGRRALRRMDPAELWAVAAQVGKDVADELVGALEEEQAEEAAGARRRRPR